jgi:subtilisin family serine protease
MKKTMIGLACALAISTAGFAAEPIKTLVLDSGTDFTHPRLAPQALANPAEASGKTGVDDDGNGYIDDIYGWNFVENSATLVDLTTTPPDYDRVLECMRLLGILQAHGKEALTPAEFQTLVKANSDKKFWAWIGFTGGWAHGTHCAGIMSTDNSKITMKAVRHLGTGAAPQTTALQAVAQVRALMLHSGLLRRLVGKKVTLEQLSTLFTQLGEQYTAQAQKEAEYLAKTGSRVINCSFGSPNESLKAVFKQNLVKEWGWSNPTDAEVQEVVNLFVKNALLARDKAFFSKSPNALFCIAAGNSSEDLDNFLASPVDVPIENKLVVAATEENKKLAAFSCHGTTKVDVAVPGVNIYATYPNGKMGYMSGTSMACPMAARFATEVLQQNPDLNPVEVKKILMGTVDKKEWLADKVRSGGVINPKRAAYAGELTKKGKSLDAAIAAAREEVPDVTPRRSPFRGPNLNDPQVRELYFSGIF